MSGPESRRDELPPLKLRPHRRLLPELELPTLRLPRPRRSATAPTSGSETAPAPAPEVAPAPEEAPARESAPSRREPAATPSTHDARAGSRVGAAAGSAADESAADDPHPRVPLYWRVLRLHHVRPSGWQRAVLVEGMVAVGIVLVLAGVATPWTILVLPVVVAVLVKLNDLVVGGLRTSPAARASSATAGTASPATAPKRRRKDSDTSRGRRKERGKARRG